MLTKAEQTFLDAFKSILKAVEKVFECGMDDLEPLAAAAVLPVDESIEKHGDPPELVDGLRAANLHELRCALDAAVENAFDGFIEHLLRRR